MNCSLPRLKADNVSLHSLYHNHQLIDTADIKDTFGVSSQTAVKVMRCVKEYMSETVEGYKPPLKHIVPVAKLFELYGWDISQINRSVSILQKGGRM